MLIHSYLNKATRLHRHWNQLKQPLRQLSYLTSRHEIKDRYDAVVIGAGGLNVLLTRVLFFFPKELLRKQRTLLTKKKN